MMMTIFAHHSFFLQVLLISYFSATCCQRNLLSNKIGDDDIFLLIAHFFLQVLLIAHVFFYLLSAQLALKIGGDLFNHFYFVTYIFTFVSWGPKFPSGAPKIPGPSAAAPLAHTITLPCILIVNRPTFESLSLAICISNYNSVNNIFISFGDSSKSGGPVPRHYWHMP